MRNGAALRIDDYEMAAPGIDFDVVRGLMAEDLLKGLSVEQMEFREFLTEAWPVFVPGYEFKPNWHIDCVCEHLQAVDMGQITRLVINVPPRSFKSGLVSVAWPSWTWTRSPWHKFMFISYSKELSTTHSIDRRRIIESPWYQQKWGAVVQLQSDQNRKDMFENTARGTMQATSTGGSATGMGADTQVFDDMMNPKEAESKAERESVIREFDQTYASRLNDKKTGRKVIVEQRLHNLDLTHHALKQGGYTHLCLPAEAPKKTIITFPISKRQVVREQGDILHPEREGAKELAVAKKELGSRAYSAQYQQNPSAESGNLIKRHWWKYFTESAAEIVRQCEIVIQMWDLSFKDDADGSWVSGQLLGRRGADIFVIDEVHAHLDFPETSKAILNFSQKWPQAFHKCVEDKANGPAIIADLKRKIPGMIAVPAKGSKESRIAASSAVIESGNVFLPRNAAWVPEYIDECANAPAEPNDRPDCLAHGIAILLNVTFVRPDEQETAPMFAPEGSTDVEAEEYV